MIKQILQQLYIKLPEINDITFHLTKNLACGFNKRVNKDGEIESRIIITNDIEGLLKRDKEINPSYKYITRMMEENSIEVTDITYIEFIVLHEVAHRNDFIDMPLEEIKAIVNEGYGNYRKSTIGMTNDEAEIVFRNIDYEKSADLFAIKSLQKIYNIV